MADAQNTEPPAVHSEERPHRLSWDFPRFRPWQYAAVGAVTAGNIYLEMTKPTLRQNGWRGPLPFDEEVRDVLVARTERGRITADTVSDVLWHSIQYHAVLVDGLLVPLAFDRFNTDVAAQMTLINWQVLGLTGLLTRAAHISFGRSRPDVHGCSDEPDSEFPCERTGYSFFSGHVAMSSAAAALSCGHHRALPLYGEGPAGAITCGTLLAAAVTVGALRIAADKHWLSDNMMGHALGFGIGFSLPWLLHYQHQFERRVLKTPVLRNTSLALLPLENGALLAAVGVL